MVGTYEINEHSLNPRLEQTDTHGELMFTVCRVQVVQVQHWHVHPHYVDRVVAQFHTIVFTFEFCVLCVVVM